jgi:TfoX/Sxy family transcriptional regulator of competence genes
MAYDEQLAERIRAIVADVDGVTERKMFGGLAFMVGGNMACGPAKDILMVRVGPDAYEDALAEPDADELQFTGRPMKGMVQVDAATLSDERLAEWVQRGLDFAGSLPPK